MSDPVARLNAALEGRYAIERELGEGGMATVYLAQDLKHNRQVALKVLKADLAQMLGKERFFSEIETTAQLQHPNILPLFDSGEADGLLFYAMPFVEGETLRDRLNREVQLPVDQALDVIRKVASALGYAHERGVVHRDIKPANILLSSGEPLVADFGIALAVQQAGEGRMTQTGLSMGTPQYMSPEQASGDRSLDPRSDIYALGAVLYEMLSGDPPFAGSSAQAVLARILTTLPSRVPAQRPTVPPHVDAAIARSLEKIPADRFTTSADFRKALDDPSFRHTTVAHIEGGDQPTIVVRRKNPALTIGLAALAGIALLAAAVGWLRPWSPAGAGSVQRYLVELSAYDQNGPEFAISPDGSRIVYVGDDGQIYLRSMGSLDAQLIPGTEGARGPFFSPSGTSIGFNAGTPDRILTLALSGGSPVPIGTLGEPVNVQATWSDDGYIYYERDAGEQAIVRALAQGGPSELVATSSDEMILERPSAIPGRTDAIMVGVNGRGMHMLDLETGDATPIDGLEQAESAHVVGDLVVWRSVDNLVIAAGFDARAGELSGPPVTLARDVLDQDFAASASGTLVYRMGDVAAAADGGDRVGFVDAEGGFSVMDSLPVMRGMDILEASISPDGTLLALGAVRSGTNTADGQILIYDIDQRTAYRLTFEGWSSTPRWLSDGTVAYLRGAGTQLATEIRAQPIDQSLPEEVLMVYPSGIDAFDARPVADLPMVVELAASDGSSAGLHVFRPGGDPTTPDLTPFLVTEAAEGGTAISPNGEWLAYWTDESGDFEVQVRAFPEGGRPYPVSDGRAWAPAWAPDHRFLFYGSPRGIQRRELDVSDDIRIGEQTSLGRAGISTERDGWRAYDVTPDGRLVGTVQSGRVERGGALAVILLNLFAEVEARLSELPR
jgi:serine/threonine-protein kinase